MQKSKLKNKAALSAQFSKLWGVRQIEDPNLDHHNSVHIHILGKYEGDQQSQRNK